MAIRVPRDLLDRDPATLAPLARLRFLTDEAPGISRRRCGRGFTYLNHSGQTVRGTDRERLVSLAVPPMWVDVWMSPAPDGHLQASGFDAAGRKQYRYHDDFRALCEQRKFERLRYFGRALTQLRKQAQLDLEEPLGSRAHAVAAAVRTIDEGLLRVGNEASADEGHYGATTLHADHVESSKTAPENSQADDGKQGKDAGGGFVTLRYIAKSGQERSVTIEDEELGDIIEEMRDADAPRLFWYDDPTTDERQNVTASDVNAWIAQITGPAFSAKDFRTWGGSRASLVARATGETTIEAVDSAAEELGNTRAIARASYVHPLVLNATDQEIEALWKRSRSSAWLHRGDNALTKLLDPNSRI